MLRKRRIEAGFSQQKLSDVTGVPLRTIQYWESGHIGRAVVESLKKVADALGCKVDDLLG